MRDSALVRRVNPPIRTKIVICSMKPLVEMPLLTDLNVLIHPLIGIRTKIVICSIHETAGFWQKGKRSGKIRTGRGVSHSRRRHRKSVIL